MALQICSKIGLRAPRERADKGVWPLVDEMYFRDMGNIIQKHAQRGEKVLAHSVALKDDIDQLCGKYGDSIWPRQRARPWLYDVGQGDKEAPYKKDLYYHDPRDRELIKTALFQVAVSRAKKKRGKDKEKAKTSDTSTRASSSSRASAESWASVPPSTRKSSRMSTIRQNDHECFANVSQNHGDAKKLKERGIWLGATRDSVVAVNGDTFAVVCDRLREDAVIKAPKDPSFQVVPYEFDRVPPKDKISVACAACGETLNSDGEPLIVQCEGVTDLDARGNQHSLAVGSGEDRERFQTNSWFFNMKLGREKVFAFMKPEHRGSEQYWTFWMAEGGYSSRFRLRTVPDRCVPERTRTMLPPPSPPKSVPARPAAEAPLNVHANGRKRRRSLSASTANNASSSASAAQTASIQYGNATADDEEQARRLVRAATNTTDEDQPPAQRQRLDCGHDEDHDSLYDLTPIPELIRRSHAINGSDDRVSVATVSHLMSAELTRKQGRTIAPPTGTPAAAPLASHSQAPQDSALKISSQQTIESPRCTHSGSLRFCVWFLVDSRKAAVILDGSMNVYEVFARLNSRMRRRLGGQSISEVGLKFHGDETILLEADDEPGWEMVLRRVAKYQEEEVDGEVVKAE
ncbi:Hypothetical predicted protein [Lecanosticta acicola]|uniref:Uncharacterized protein n=1 Tax=Lecanosticta acicola TaxID=111012 RepID=A0AAI8YVI0_9PEZI|nr:Hypothetical predicted protein [Lecanosticta acicola]